MAEQIINSMLQTYNGNYFEVAKQIHKNFNKGNYTFEEYLEYMDILAAKGVANKWAS